MRVGVVDLGTNSTRLLVADVRDDHVEEVARRTRITRLGEGVDERRKLLPLPIARVRNVLADYRRELDALGAERVLAVGTSAIRDAENGEAFLGEIEWSYGFATRLLSGDEEADLTRRGVAEGRALDQDTLVLDVGGGSTELITAQRRISLDLGCVRLTERHLHSDPPGRHELDRCAAEVRETLPELHPTDALGVAGTITTLAALDLGLTEYDPERVHGHRLSAPGVQEQLDRLASLPLADRRELPALEPERAPVIVAGGVIVREVLARYGLGGLEASERDILHGAALEAAALPEAEEGDAPPGAYTCC
ncbi:MAG TPA: Ppx/GppA phosphatase family protein [Gaiellaceae bacterium]|jgi:exopolyphosphatase/guanosine-5'-triphosphate,3'-diphosphate pyrophosphatase|nr:Ppx/GppA phosphatase family protein [Gaiellaceae bacterium]